ncbi:HET-domain-containing protein, partial [Pleomassaria siparia CBS 279.74]
SKHLLSKTMSQYCYSPLLPGHGNIRLLRLLPHEDESADIQCELYDYSLQDSCRTHLYEALSYVWGDPEEKLPIFLHKHRFDVTINLHSALFRLRNHSMERILWVDAICIDQANREEKEHQIQSMANIYGQASRVVVWLGEAADDSTQALEEIRVAGGRMFSTHSSGEVVKEAVLALLLRPWFRRIWILQEVAAARHVSIICGSMEIDGYAFCLGVEQLKEFYDERPDLQSSFRSVAYLIRGATFRRKGLGQDSKETWPLGELVEMYRTHEATLRSDKVYALLGMSSDDVSKAGLLPDYSVPWQDLFEALIRFLLCKETPMKILPGKTIAVIESQGCILGKIMSIQRDISVNGGQEVHVKWRNKLDGLEDTEEFTNKLDGLEDTEEFITNWTLQPSTESTREGDVICLLQGASNPTIIRFCQDCWAIIRITATPPPATGTEPEDECPKYLQLAQAFRTHNLRCIWNWEGSPGKLQGQDEYE